MQAVILAAGMGKRLKELTRDNTKCMVKVNGVTLIERMLDQIDRHHFSQIVIVVGYQAENLMDFVGSLDVKTPIRFIQNPIYDKTNNIYSLYLASEWLCKEDTVLFESDLIFDDSVLDTLLDDPRDTLALAAKYEPWMDGTCLKLDKQDAILDFVSKKTFRFDETQQYYKTVNIYKFSKDFSQNCYVPFLAAYQSAIGTNEYYEQVLRVITMLDSPQIQAKRLENQKWYEIDDIQDLDIAESLFNVSAEEMYDKMMSRYGGFWRYPKLVDFCYLVNPFFPPAKMLDEMRAGMDELVTQYPSGMRVNALLAAKMFNVRSKNIVVGNGAAELIKSLLSQMKGSTGFIRPTFEEYPNRYNTENSVYFVPANADFSYTANDLITYFDASLIENLVVINPDNPSGNYMPKKDILKLMEWSRQKGIRLIVDESFADFADEEAATVLEQDLLVANPHVYVVKSISKCYGVPGVRLGVLASGDAQMIQSVKRDVAIWNINSFGEFFLQIIGKYQGEYKRSLQLLREERKYLAQALSAIDGIRVIPSQANYLMVEFEESKNLRKLLSDLLYHHWILAKDLTAKTNGKHYVRFAIRNRMDNDALIQSLKKELNIQ